MNPTVTYEVDVVSRRPSGRELWSATLRPNHVLLCQMGSRLPTRTPLGRFVLGRLLDTPWPVHWSDVHRDWNHDVRRKHNMAGYSAREFWAHLAPAIGAGLLIVEWDEDGGAP